MRKSFGLSVALATPFDDEGNIAVARMVDHARFCLAQGCDSVTLFGTTGEGASVGAGERETVLAAMLGAGVGPDEIVVAVLVNSAGDAADQAKHALKRGVRNILLAPPSYFKNVSDEGLFQWFADVFFRLGPHARDILVYNIPSVTMVVLSAVLVGRLKSAFPYVVAGVKDSSGNWDYTRMLLETHGDLIILIGDERHLAKGISLGSEGAISGMANFLPRELRTMIETGIDDARIGAFVAELVKHPVTPAVKAMIAKTSGMPDWLRVRAPLVAASTDTCERLSAEFDTLLHGSPASDR